VRLIRTATLVLLIAVASCNMAKGGKADPDKVVARQLNMLQIAIENDMRVQGKVHVAVLGVVDAVDMTAGEGAEAPDPEALSAARRRERSVRQAIGEVLVQNRLMAAVQPSADQAEQARKAISAANSPALDAAEATAVGKALGADYLVCALIDDEGKSINVVAQRTTDGVVVFQDVLKDWSAIGAAAPAGA